MLDSLRRFDWDPWPYMLHVYRLHTLLLWLRDLQPGPPILQSAWNNLKLPYQIPSRSTILGVLPCQRLHISITGDSPRIYHSFSSPAAIRDREIRWQEGSTIQLALRKPLSHSRLAPGTKLKENLSFLLWRCIGLVAPKKPAGSRPNPEVSTSDSSPALWRTGTADLLLCNH
jgi:hypothetical protein